MHAGIEARGWSRGRRLGEVAGEVLNTRVDSHIIMHFRVERNFGFQVRLEVGQVSKFEVRANRWVLKG
jgi:hypothetical protein